MPDDPTEPIDPTDPVVIHARREGIMIGLAWLCCTVYCVVVSYWLGYSTPNRPLDVGDVRPILGIPSWVVWGYLAPWFACGIFTIWFVSRYMVDDDLGDEVDG